MTDLQSGYIASDDLLRKINASETEQLIFKNLSIEVPDFISLYNIHSPLWVFAFLKALYAACEKNPDMETVISMTDLFIRIEEWILEDSHFLTSFPESKQNKIVGEAEEMLFYAYARREALRLIISGKADRYVSDMFYRIEISGGNLYDRERKLMTVFAIFLFKTDLLSSLTTEFIRLFKFISELNIPRFDPVFLTGVIETYLTREADELDRVLLTGLITPEIRQKTESIIRLVGTEFLLAKRSGQEISVLRRLLFYRYMCIIDERHPQALKNIAFNTLTCMAGRPVEFAWEEIIDFSLSRFADKISYFTAGSVEYDDSERIFEGTGTILLADRTFTIAPCQTGYASDHLSGFVSCLDDAVTIRTKYKHKIDLNTCSDLSVLSRHWETALDEFKNRPKQTTRVSKERPPVNELVKIRVKNLTPSLPLLVFACIEDDQYEGEGVLHVSGVTRVKLSTLEGVFCPGDRMTARVIESTENRLAFSILDEVESSIGARFSAGEYTHARLLSKREKLLTWVSEDGYLLFTFPSSVYDPEVDDTYTLQLKEVNYNGYIKAKIEEPVTDVEIDVHEAVARMLEYYIDNSADSGEENPEQGDEPESDLDFPEECCKYLEYILDLYTNSCANYIQKFNLLQTARLIARICGNASTEEFYKYRILYMLELHRFSDQKNFNAQIITNDIIQQFPRLSKAQMILSLLSAGNDESRTDELHTYITSEQKQVASLARFLLARYYVNAACPRLVKELDAEILSLLSFGVDEPDEENREDEVNFGRENNNREFKTTVVFPPESQCIANIDRQMENILAAICGFLNAEGGTLYIGVNDGGFPQGIQADLKYMQCNDDKYQLLLRRYIVKELGKDINGLIAISFRNYDKKTVCAIAVPAYHQVVSFKDKVWQRQGNSTRPLEGDALKFLKERKKALGISRPAVSPEFPGDIPVPVPVPVPVQELPNPLPDTPAVVKSAPLAEVTTLIPIPTSALNHSLDEEQEAVAFFTILESGKFVVTEAYPYRSNDARITLPIYEENRTGYLLQVYENGYVNRVAISTILSKKRDYEYINALFRNAEIRFIAFAHKNDFIYLKTGFKGEEYIKILSLKRIKINTDLSLKGTPLFSVPFDSIIAVDVLHPQQAAELKNIHSETVTTLGSPVTALSVIGDVLFLNDLFQP